MSYSVKGFFYAPMIKVNEQNQVSAKELHEALKIKTPFKKWIDRMLEYGFNESKDFWTKMSESSKGRPSLEYYLSIDTAKEIAMIQRTPEGKAIREYLLDLSTKKDDGELLTHAETIALVEITRAAGIFEFRKLAKSKHISKYLPNNPKDKDYAKANIERNTICGIDRKEIEAKLTQIGKKFNGVEKGIIQIDKHDLIRIAVIDTMLHFGKSETYAKNVANLAKTLAQSDTSIVFDKENTMFKIPAEYAKVTKLLS